LCVSGSGSAFGPGELSGSNHLGTPVWGVLAACAVLGFDGHQLGDLAGVGRRERSGFRLDVSFLVVGGFVDLDSLLQCTPLIS
jgi:hypothetical protein